MTDKELLELASKTYGPGLKYIPDYGWVYENTAWWVEDAQEWNPLTDDGDALRLAVKLRLVVRASVDDSDCALVEWSSDCLDITDADADAKGEDIYSATRRAIVRAAAEVGKGLLTHEQFVLMFPGRFEESEVERAAAEIGKAMP